MGGIITSVTAAANQPDLSAVAAYLAREPVINTVALGLVRQAIASQPDRDATYVAAITRGGSVVAAAVRSDFPKLTVSAPASATDLQELAGMVHQAMPSLPCAVGRVGEVRAFAQAWGDIAGTEPRLGVPQRIHVLGTLDPPTGVSGVARTSDRRDAALVANWYTAFRREALGEAEAAATTGPEGMGAGARFDIWVDPDPVCLVGSRLSGEGVWRIGPVYTPPARRRRGYASALTSAVSADLVAQGATCCLYTDLRNPTSNHVYRAIGYRPAADIEEYWFPGEQN